MNNETGNITIEASNTMCPAVGDPWYDKAVLNTRGALEDLVESFGRLRTVQAAQAKLQRLGGPVAGPSGAMEEVTRALNSALQRAREVSERSAFGYNGYCREILCRVVRAANLRDQIVRSNPGIKSNPCDAVLNDALLTASELVGLARDLEFLDEVHEGWWPTA